MRYEEAKELIRRELSKWPDGLTWRELKARLDLPYERFCPEWTKSLESDIGLVRRPGRGRAHLWSLRDSERS